MKRLPREAGGRAGIAGIVREVEAQDRCRSKIILEAHQMADKVSESVPVGSTTIPKIWRRAMLRVQEFRRRLSMPSRSIRLFAFGCGVPIRTLPCGRGSICA